MSFGVFLLVFLWRFQELCDLNRLVQSDNTSRYRKSLLVYLCLLIEKRNRYLIDFNELQIERSEQKNLANLALLDPRV